MRHSIKTLGIAALLGLGLMASSARAAEIMNLTVTFTENGTNTGGTWSAFEQNSDTSLTSGLAGIKFDITVTGGVTITTGANKLPFGSDASLGGTGFSGNRTNGVLGGGMITGMTANQSTSNTLNNAGDVTSIFPGVGNVAETLNAGDDGSGDGGVGDQPGNITHVTVAFPALIASGTWTDPTAGPGKIFVSTSTLLTTLLPNPLPAATTSGKSVQTFSPSAINSTPALINQPEPASIGLLAIGGLMAFARRRSVKA